MINLNSVTPPENVKFVADFLALMVDPKAASARIAEYKAAATELRTASEAMMATQEAFASEETKHRAALKAASDQHAASLRDAQRDFDDKCQQREVALTARERRANELEKKTAADAEVGAALKADLERRVELVRRASAA